MMCYYICSNRKMAINYGLRFLVYLFSLSPLSGAVPVQCAGEDWNYTRNTGGMHTGSNQAQAVSNTTIKHK